MEPIVTPIKNGFYNVKIPYLSRDCDADGKQVILYREKTMHENSIADEIKGLQQKLDEKMAVQTAVAKAKAQVTEIASAVLAEDVVSNP